MNWLDPKEKISNHFTVKEACWLPSWGKLYSPTAQEQTNILKTAAIMDKIRDLLEKPIIIHCWIRPVAYNKAIGGAPASMHISGLAADFDAGENCDITRTALLPYLSKWRIRMENMPGGPWVHIDLKPINVDSQRYFKP